MQIQTFKLHIQLFLYLFSTFPLISKFSIFILFFLLFLLFLFYVCVFCFKKILLIQTTDPEIPSDWAYTANPITGTYTYVAEYADNTETLLTLNTLTGAILYSPQTSNAYFPYFFGIETDYVNNAMYGYCYVNGSLTVGKIDIQTAQYSPLVSFGGDLPVEYSSALDPVAHIYYTSTQPAGYNGVVFHAISLKQKAILASSNMSNQLLGMSWNAKTNSIIATTVIGSGGDDDKWNLVSIDPVSLNVTAIHEFDLNTYTGQHAYDAQNSIYYIALLAFEDKAAQHPSRPRIMNRNERLEKVGSNYVTLYAFDVSGISGRLLYSTSCLLDDGLAVAK